MEHHGTASVPLASPRVLWHGWTWLDMVGYLLLTFQAPSEAVTVFWGFWLEIFHCFIAKCHRWIPEAFAGPA